MAAKVIDNPRREWFDEFLGPDVRLHIPAFRGVAPILEIDRFLVDDTILEDDGASTGGV